jgi:hypothetical protein
MKAGQIKTISILLTILMLTSALSGCGPGSKKLLEEKFGPSGVAQAAEFAPYREVEVKVSPQIAPYRVNADLSNIENRGRFEFSPEAQALLAQNAFVVLPQMQQEFFMLYEFNRYDGIPNLITTDAMLHNYHLFFEHLLKSAEENQLRNELQQLNQGMLEASQKQYEALKNSPWENAARRNLAFFAVGSRLLDPGAKIPQEVIKEAEAELQLIQEHNQTAISPLMTIGLSPDPLESLKEDYTQYIPRGHYTHSENLKSYFQNMMWYGRMTFRLKNEDETRSAVLMTLALKNGLNQASWDKIYQTTSFFVGESDDPGCIAYSNLLEQVYGVESSLNTLISDNEKWQQFLSRAKELQGPAINSIPIFDASIQPDREQEIKGFRFMGQRYTIDADIFQRLVYREVGENQQGERRLLPRGLDIPAAMGSEEAYRILEDEGQTQYQNYPQNMTRLRQHISGLDPAVWHHNLYWSWIKTLKPLTLEKPQGYPSFMLGKAWARKSLNTFLGSWTELKHDTILYAKQVYAEMGGGFGDEIDDRGYVEPDPHCYANLASLSAMTREGLQARGLIAERDAQSLQLMETLALNLKTISEKELQNQALTDEEYELIRSFGGQLEHFWMETLRDQEGGRSALLNNNPAMLVADVATAPPDLVLEEGNGYIHSIYAVVPVEGKLRIVKGGVYSHYEFSWPASDRLTDEKWRGMLENKQTPPAPEWTRAFAADGSCRIIMPWENEP